MTHAEFVNKLTGEFIAFCDSEGPGTKSGRSELMRMLFDSVVSSCGSRDDYLSLISAPNAVIEVTDRDTGELFRRYLELSYTENDNGIRLGGEDMGGRATDIVFLSSAALEKMRDLRGGGIDSPRCKE